MTILADEELALASELITQMVTEGLACEPPRHAADVELLALLVQTPFCWPESPPELAHALVTELARRGDELAAGVLAGMERLAGEPLAGLAAAEARRLAQRGVVSPHADTVGDVHVADARRLEVADDVAEIWFVLLGRPRSDHVQPLTVFVEHGSCGTLVAGATLGEPMPRDEANAVIDRVPATASALAPDALARSLRGALDAMVSEEIGLDIEAGRILPLLERALTGHAGRFPRPRAEEPDPEEAGHAAADTLVDAFEAHLEDAGAADELIEHAPFVAHTMLSWKLEYADGELTRWDSADLREFLLDWFPRKVTCDEATIGLAPVATVEFLRFLDAGDLLESPVGLATLTAASRRLAPAFERACRDPHAWGPTKRLALEMLDDGVDVNDEASVAAWIEAYNEGAAAAAPQRSPDQRRRDHRKAARKARKRNRR